MAFVATASTKEARSFSLGPLKIQIMTYAVASGDVAGTVTADRLSEAQHILIDGAIAQSAVATYSGNVVTLAFADPAATRVGTLIVLGR